jgi:ABC-type Mn2+/Zn2+ transport system ATPase subunit
MYGLLRRPSEHHGDAPVVSFDRVWVQYDNASPALEDISFHLHAGERIAVVGPNGAGKSTLIKVTAGLLQPTRGLADVYGYGPGGHICIGYVPQRSQVDLAFPVTVGEVVMMGRVARMGLLRQAGRHDREVVARSLEEVGMSAFAGKQIGELSGGQQQRVFVARALAQEAGLLLMDEPLTGLDGPSQDAIFEILDRLGASGMTVMLSTHDLQSAGEHFDKLMLLNHRLIGFGPPATVLTPAHLREAYGSHLTVLEGPGGTVALPDTCCEGE